MNMKTVHRKLFEISLCRLLLTMTVHYSFISPYLVQYCKFFSKFDSPTCTVILITSVLSQRSHITTDTYLSYDYGSVIHLCSSCNIVFCNACTVIQICIFCSKALLYPIQYVGSRNAPVKINFSPQKWDLIFNLYHYRNCYNIICS